MEDSYQCPPFKPIDQMVKQKEDYDDLVYKL